LVNVIQLYCCSYDDILYDVTDFIKSRISLPVFGSKNVQFQEEKK